MAIKTASSIGPAVGPSTEDPDEIRRFEWAQAIDANRDQWGRPKIKLPNSSKEVGYRRASSFGSPLEDDTQLTKWKMRQVARGVARRPDIALAVTRAEVGLDGNADAAKSAKKTINELCEQAMDVVESGAKASIGTSLHHVFEMLDFGKDPGHVPEQWRPDVAAYRNLTAGFRMLSIERFVVQDELRVAGTTDRVAEVVWPLMAPDGTVIEPGSIVIGDVKGLALSTPIPTPDGWSTMGELRPGDRVIGSDGRPCTVTTKSEVKRLGTYVVRFDDGSEVVCDPEHIWWVTGGSHRYGPPRPVPIETIRANLRSNQGQAWWRVPVTEPLDLPERDLPIDPYLLGCWLGDGCANAGRITKGRDLFELLERDGHTLGKPQANHSDQCWTRTVIGLCSQLRAAGILGEKRIPEEYLRASVQQRTRLLQGLMDTDGSWNRHRHRATFAVTDKALALAVEELALSLGQRAQFNEVAGRGFGRAVTSYRVEFTPRGVEPFRLPRKAAAFRADLDAGKITQTRAARRVIVSIEPGPDVLTACIAVDSPDRTYLCGERMIPTHNTAQSMDFAGSKFAVQCWVYATGEPYDPVQKTRVPWGHDRPRTDWGLIFHVPSGGATASLHWVDLTTAGEAARDSLEVYTWRNKGKNMITKGTPGENFTATCEAATTVDQLTAAYERASLLGVWDDLLKQRFSRRKAELLAEAGEAVAR